MIINVESLAKKYTIFGDKEGNRYEPQMLIMLVEERNKLRSVYLANISSEWFKTVLLMLSKLFECCDQFRVTYSNIKSDILRA